MVDVVKAGTAVKFTVTPGEGGYPTAAHSVGLSVLIDGNPVWTSSTDISFEEAVSNGVTFPAEVITTSKVREFLVLGMLFKDAQGGLASPAALHHDLVVESSVVLRPGENSFAPWSALVLETFNLADIDDFKSASKDEQIAALIAAYYNIGKVQTDFVPPRTRRYLQYDQSLLDAPLWSVGWANPLAAVRSTLMLQPDHYSKLLPGQLQQLVRAQIVEASFILGGNPIERQRLNGLLSMGAGESTYMYRTSKPLELPICRRAARELSGIITYVQHIG